MPRRKPIDPDRSQATLRKVHQRRATYSAYADNDRIPAFGHRGLFFRRLVTLAAAAAFVTEAVPAGNA